MLRANHVTVTVFDGQETTILMGERASELRR